MSERKFELADQSQILAFEETASVFFRDILGMAYSEVLVTDESALSDFAGCGDSCSDFPSHLTEDFLPRRKLDDLWFMWVREKVSKRYGIEISDAIYLVDLFRQIESAKDPNVVAH